MWCITVQIIRDFQTEDTDFVLKHSINFAPPDRKHLISEKVLEQDGVVLGYGQIKAIAEVIMVTNHNLPTATKAKVMRNLHDRAIYETSQAGFDELHGVMLDPAYAELMKKHFGYKDSKGKWLVLEV